MLHSVLLLAVCSDVQYSHCNRVEMFINGAYIVVHVW